jgi:hypothetical protein
MKLLAWHLSSLFSLCSSMRAPLTSLLALLLPAALALPNQPLLGFQVSAPIAAQFRAACLDGSSPAFYYSPGFPDKWIIL